MTRMAAGHQGREAAAVLSNHCLFCILQCCVDLITFSLSHSLVIRAATAPVLNSWVTANAAGWVTSIKASKPCTERFTGCRAGQCSHQAGSSPDLPPSVSFLSCRLLEKKKATSKHLHFFNVLQRGKKREEKKKRTWKGHASTLQCPVFCNWKKKTTKQMNPGAVDITTIIPN